MSKLYTLDNKLLTETPDIRVGDKVYAVDDRKKTVEKIMALNLDTSSADFGSLDKVIELALGSKAAKEIQAMDLRFSAYESLVELIIAAVMNEEPEKVKENRFQNDKSNDK